MFHIVLVEPEIPSNTGNIARTCVATNSNLHLIGNLGFELTDKYLKRAGLDYWEHLRLEHHLTWESFKIISGGSKRFIYASTKAKIPYYDFKFEAGDYLIFGKETKGLPEEWVYGNPDRAITIPMPGKVRSLNLSNAVAVVL